MRATARQSALVQVPVYHLTISFDREDQVAPAEMQAVADRVLRDLGLAAHQAIMVAHKDRDHAHVHVMVNRVHPETGVAWERWQDRPTIERSLREVERAFGLRVSCPVDCISWTGWTSQLVRRVRRASGERPTAVVIPPSRIACARACPSSAPRTRGTS